MPLPKGSRTDLDTIEAQPGSSKPTTSSTDRFALLQKKVGDLERIHAEDKRSHTAEVDRLRNELTRTLQSTDKLDKLTKSHSALEARYQEIKKSHSQDQLEIKDLRVKLRLAQNERVQLTNKQGEKDDAKKALHTLEARRREEVKEKDKKIAELEKCLLSEKKKREATDELAKAKDVEVASSKKEVARLRTEMESSKSKASLALQSASDSEAATLVQLEDHRALLSRVAKEYGKLASTSVPLSVYKQLKAEHDTQSFHILKLERRMANSEGQVVELVHLMRHMQEEAANARLALEVLEEENAYLRESTRNYSPTPKDDIDMAILIHDIHTRRRQWLRDVQSLDRFMSRTTVELYGSALDSALLWYSAASKVLDENESTLETHALEASSAIDTQMAIQSQLNTVQSECIELQNRCTNLSVALDKTRVEAKDHEEVRKKVDARNQILRMTEDGLRAEIDQLTQEITEAEKYKEAYFSYVDQVGLWADSTSLAEQEAGRLAKLNAEILGHHNPSQRIMYVDRIRKELADVKHQLLVLNREKNVLVGNNDVLTNELEMYKSVMVVDKPRTAITRIERAPLLFVNGNMQQKAGGMTMDELY